MISLICDPSRVSYGQLLDVFWSSHDPTQVNRQGPDYGTPERVPEYEVVRSYGGRTALVGDPKDHATSDLIARIRRVQDLAG